MSIKKTILARLLANENIEVVHGNYETAFFDVKNRMLGLPLWNDEELYDMLIGHEVSHALHTPADKWIAVVENKENLIPQSVYNVVEDIRIERKIQDKYPGLVSSFIRGYKRLHEKDFFNLSGEQFIRIKDYNFIDRLNIKAKLRDLVEVEFTQQEEELVSKAHSADTWEEVDEVVKEVYAYMKKRREELKNKSEKNEDIYEVSVPSNGETSETKSENDFEDGESVDARPEEGDSDESENGENFQTTSEESDENSYKGNVTDEKNPLSQESVNSLDSVTDRQFENFKKNNLLERDNYGKVVTISQGLNEQQKSEILISYKELCEHRAVVPDKELTKTFIKENEAVVNNMVKEFDLRKSAFQYAKASISRSGSLDTNKLHNYKFTDDIFLRRIKLADSKNHGMVMLVDYSGSMMYTLKNVIKQTLVLAMFCKKANIPFEVYGFTGGNWNGQPFLDEKQYTLFPDHIEHTHIRVFNILSSSMPKTVYNDAFGNLVKQSEIDSDNYYGGRYNNVGFESLGDTPLNESLIVMYDVLRKFRVKNNVQKLSFITLTDGGANSMVFTGNDMIRVFRQPKKVKIDGNYMVFDHRITRKILLDMKSKGIADTIVNYDLSEKRYGKRSVNDAAYACESKKTVDREAKYKEYLKTGSATFDKTFGYDRVIIIQQENSVLSINDDELEIEENATKSQITRAFKKFSSSKKNSRVLASKFMEIVA